MSNETGPHEPGTAWWGPYVEQTTTRRGRVVQVVPSRAGRQLHALTRATPRPAPAGVPVHRVLAWRGNPRALPAEVAAVVEGIEPELFTDADVVDVVVDEFDLVDHVVELGGVRRTVTVAGDGELPSDVAAAFRAARLTAALAGALVLGGAAAAAWLAHTSRHLWFVTRPESLAMLAVAAGVTLVGLVVGPALLTRGGRSRAMAWTATAAVACFLVAGDGALAWSAQPSLEHALTADRRSAEAELDALVDLGVQPELATAELERLRLLDVNELPLEQASAVARDGLLTDAGRAAAAEHLFGRVEREVRTRHASGDFAQTAALFGLLLASQQSEPRANALFIPADLHALDGCGLDVSCIQQGLATARGHGATDADLQPSQLLIDDGVHRRLLEHTQRANDRALSVAERKKACTDARTDTETFKGIAPAALLSSATLDRACAAADRAEAAERAAAQRAEAAQRRSASRWASSPLLCGDGSYSPSCTCGGSHRGCCSHHGGVAGCSAD